MSSMKFKVTWKTILLPIIGLIAFFIYLYLFNVDIPTVIATMQHVDLPIYFLAIVFLILETFFFSCSWLLLLNFLSVKLSVMKSFLYVWYGVFVDIVIPAESVSGEISRVYLVTREHNGTSGKVIASLVMHRLIGMGITVISLLVGISALLIKRQVSGIVLNLSVFLAILTTIFLLLLIFLCFKENWTLKIVDALIRLVEYLSRKRWRLTRIRDDAIRATKIFHGSMKDFGHAPKIVFASVLLYFLNWLFSWGVAYLVLLSLGFSAHWSTVVVTSSIVTAIKSIPLGVPFEVGLPEITMTTLYMVLGVPFDISATATILTRILTVWLRFFVGFAAQQWLEIKTIRTTSQLNSSPRVEKA